jgi:hypothetical protein
MSLLDDITQAAYIECALWSSTDDDGTPLDTLDYCLSNDAIATMRADMRDFLDYLDREGIEWSDAVSFEMMGHDFWLTRNGHGAGFWDRGLGELGDALTAAAKTYGEQWLYVGDDGLIYCG